MVRSLWLHSGRKRRALAMVGGRGQRRGGDAGHCIDIGTSPLFPSKEQQAEEADL